MKTFRTYIDNVKVQDEGGKLPFTAKIVEAPTTITDDHALMADDIEDAAFYVIVIENEAVEFSADKDYVRAADLETIEFKFTAVNTPIRKGSVQFSIPSRMDCPR